MVKFYTIAYKVVDATFAISVGTLKFGNSMNEYMCICAFETRVSNFQRSFIALLICTNIFHPNSISIVSNVVFVLLIKTIYRSKILTQ